MLFVNSKSITLRDFHKLLKFMKESRANSAHDDMNYTRLRILHKLCGYLFGNFNVWLNYNILYYINRGILLNISYGLGIRKLIGENHLIKVLVRRRT